MRRLKPDSLNLSVNTVVGSVLGRCYLLSRLRQEIFDVENSFARQWFKQSPMRKRRKRMEQYTTQMDAARRGIVTKELEIVAKKSA